MKVGLVMIVKDEEAVIERALLSAKLFISTYVIVDTGSTDRTKEIITATMSGIPGLLVDRPWVSFGHNRSEALKLCDGRMDWAIMLDADDNLAGAVPPTSIWQTRADAFMILCLHGPVRHYRTQIFRTGADWYYEGAVHENPVCRSKKTATIAALPADTYAVTRCEGNRSKDPNKYIKDAQLLEAELLTKPNCPRTLFYIAQSYRDARNMEKARYYYKKRADISGGWEQETYMTLVYLILLTEDDDERRKLTWRAINLYPERLDAQYMYLNMRRSPPNNLEPTQESYAIAAFTKSRKFDETDLFVTPQIYNWGMDDELSIAAFKTSHFRESYEASMRCVMTAPDENMRGVALRNARAAYQYI